MSDLPPEYVPPPDPAPWRVALGSLIQRFATWQYIQLSKLANWITYGKPPPPPVVAKY